MTLMMNCIQKVSQFNTDARKEKLHLALKVSHVIDFNQENFQAIQQKS